MEKKVRDSTLLLGIILRPTWKIELLSSYERFKSDSGKASPRPSVISGQASPRTPDSSGNESFYVPKSPRNTGSPMSKTPNNASMHLSRTSLVIQTEFNDYIRYLRRYLKII